jgi:hypothetical protein
MDNPTLIETPTVFCSKKLSDFLGLKTKRTELSDSCEKWNGHLFYLDGRKCLIFMHKETSYSVVLLDIVKKDLANLNELFIDNFIKQLYSDKILLQDKERKIRNEYKQLSLQLTDNDKSIIGSINDCVFRIQFCKNDDGNVLTNAKVYINNYLNATPMGSKKFYYAKELMKAKITSVNLTLD